MSLIYNPKIVNINSRKNSKYKNPLLQTFDQ